MENGVPDLLRTGGRKAVRMRLSQILECLSDGTRVPVDELIRDTRRSPATIRRDLRRLQSGGLVHRDHGGVFLAEPTAFEAFLYDPGFRDQLEHMAAEKRRIGAAAAALIRDGETVGISARTTTAQIARLLPERQPTDCHSTGRRL